MSMTTVPRGRSNEPPTSTVRGGPGQYPVRLLAGLVAALLALAGTLVATGTPARAAGNQPPVLGHGANLLYVYLDTGELLDTAGLVGVVAGPDGSVVGTEPGTYGPAEEPGVWTVLLPGAGFNTGYDWRVEAQDAQGAEIPGRVWTNQYGMRQGSVLHEADLEFWVLNDTGYRYKVDLRGYNGINSIIQANALGNTTPDCTPLYGSVELDDPLADPVTCGARYRVFFEEPAPDLPETADGPEGTVYVAPDLLTAEDLVVDDLAFTPEGAGAAAGTFSWSLTERFHGVYWLEIDVDGDGSYDGAVDRRVLMAGDGSPSYSYEFDGLDGQGDPVSMCVEMNARVYFDKLGEVHILQTDVEARGGGIEVTRLDGPGAPDRTIYWDDTPLSEPRDTEVWPGLDGTAGVDSEGGTHGWDYHENGWGNERLIDDWAYLPLDHAAAEITVGGTCLEITKTSTAGADTRPGDVVTYEVTATNTGDGDYTEAAPAVVVDDLSAVLDDGELVAGSVSADRGGDLDVTATTVTWSGPLAAGESVTVSYDVELVAGGDGELRNVAWEPFDPEDPLPPTCDPAVDGRDAVTGEPCAVTEHELPRLTIEKTADRTELPALGEELTYTVTLTSAGPGDFTADSPAAFSDDLSGVLDDADLVEGSVSASTGTADVSGDLLTWEGTLAAGEAATVSYTVVYTAAGDHELTNLACIDPRDALDPAQVCDVVSVPGSGLEWTKSVDPAAGTPVEAGEELTYTLTFANVGNTAASVDTTDDLTGVLDDAELVSGPTAEDGLQADLAGGTLTITGEVPAGESRTVTYTVRVLELDEVGGDGVLTNALACPAGTPEPCAPEVTENPVRALDVTKSAEPVEGVDTGDVVTYTVRVTNVGEGGYTADSPAVVVDDMTGLLDDARYLGDAAVTTGVGELDWTSPHLTWTGPLAAGQTVEVTYSVQVTNTGDHLLANTVGPVCATDLCPPPVTVELPLPYVVPGKSSDPEPGTGLSAGDEVTYLLTWTNTGQATGRVDATDDLSGVLDDAVLSGGPTVVEGDLTVTLDEGGLRVEGELAPGADAAVSYTVTVLPDGERADNLLDNVLVPDVPQVTCEDGECAEVPPPTTSHPVGELETAKSADPESGATVRADQEVTYVLTFSSVGEASVAVDHEDVLSGVLDDATLVDGPTASTPALEVSGPDDTGRIAVSGVLAAGDVETVTYTVRVLPEDERGDDLLANFLVGSGEDAPEECGAEDPRCTVHEVVDPSDDPGAGAGTGSGSGSGSGLPRTGLDVVGPAAAAVLLLTAGLLAVTRRRSVG